MAKSTRKELRRDWNRASRGDDQHPSKSKKPRGHRRKGAAPPSSPEEYKVLEVDTEMIRRYLCLNFGLPIEELRKRFDNERTSFGEASIISVMLRIFDTGDVYALNALYDRMIGPVLRRVHVTGERPFAEWPLEKLIEEKERLSQRNRETVEMIEKERKLVALVNAGEIKPGEYTAQTAPNAEENSAAGGHSTSVKSFVAK